jgi:hypothetical protein
MRRLSTHTFARRVVAQLESGAKLSEAIELPMIVDILATMDEHDAARFFILGPFQTFKSLVGQLRLLRNHLVRARPALWYSPTEKFAKEFADTKLNPLIEALPGLQSLHFDTGVRGNLDRAKSATLSRRLTGGASHLLLSAKTENDRHGKTACDLYLDEVHVYEPGWIAQISNRRGAYPDEFTETYMSTGLLGGTEAAQLWAESTQMSWHCRCPSCQRLFEPRFTHYGPLDPATQKPTIVGGIRYTRAWRDDGLPDETAIAATLRYECPRCHETFPDTHGTRVQFSGTATAPRGIYVATNANPSARNFGWTFPGVATRPWLPIVMRKEKAELARSRGDLGPLGEWVREECAGIWTPHEHVTEQRLRPPGGYQMADLTVPGFDALQWWPAGDVDPNGKPYLIATVDVQQDWFRLVVRFWNRRSQSRLVFTDTVTTPSRIADICDALGVLRERTVLDRRHKPQYVRMLCAQFGWRSLMGEKDKDYIHPDNVRRIISPPTMLDPFLGTAHQGRALIIENNFAKWSALDRLNLLRQLSANDGTPLFTAADNAPDWYFKEIDAYHRIPKFEKGVESHEWQAHGPDHTADVEIMGIGVASALNLTGAESLTPAETASPPTA